MCAVNKTKTKPEIVLMYLGLSMGIGALWGIGALMADWGWWSMVIMILSALITWFWLSACWVSGGCDGD